MKYWKGRVILILAFFACMNAKAFHTDSTWVVSLQKSSFIKKAIKPEVIFENDSFKIVTSKSIIIGQVEADTKLYPKIKEDSTLLYALKTDTINGLSCKKIAEKLQLTDRLQFKIDDIIMQGLCVIECKTEKKFLKTLQIQNYADPKFDYGGRKFLTKYGMILQTVDWEALIGF